MNVSYFIQQPFWNRPITLENLHWRISNIHHYLTIYATKTLLCAFVLSKLDYCNYLLSDSPKHLLDKLQKVENSAARLVKPLLQKLHWLPIVSRIQYKVATLCYNSFT